jgi:pimeloyl-ACP methyl ester carboxylesterase
MSAVLQQETLHLWYEEDQLKHFWIGSYFKTKNSQLLVSSGGGHWPVESKPPGCESNITYSNSI